METNETRRALSALEESLINMLHTVQELQNALTVETIDKTEVLDAQGGRALSVKEYKTGCLLLSDYRIVATLAQGMYKVAHLETGELCTIKVTSLNSGQAYDEIITSQRVNNLIGSKYIHGVQEVRVQNNYVHGIAEYIPGESFEDLPRYKSDEELLGYLLEAGQLIKVVHEHGILHRDIKPSNFILDIGNRVHMIDLGIALLLDPTGKTVLPNAVGTQRYASPEAYIIGGVIDVRADIYSYAKMFSTLYNIPRGTILEDVIEKAMSEKPSERYATMGELLAAIR